jgi:hypothetical protein
MKHYGTLSRNQRLVVYPPLIGASFLNNIDNIP